MHTAKPNKAGKTFSNDLLASVVVFLVALPLCMGVAIASGVPPARGLITGMIGGIVVGFLAGSPLQVSGPAAGLTVIVWDLVQRFGLEALGAIVILGGVFQLVAGLLKGGRWFQAVPPSVIYGMLGGIGVLIFSGQFHVMIDDKPRENGVANILALPEALLKGVIPSDGSAHHLAALIGVLTIAIIVLWNRFAPRKLKLLPGALLAVVIATVVANLFGLPVHYVSVPDSLLGAASWPTADSLSFLLDPSVIGAALGIAVVASAETLLCAAATDKMHEGPRTNYDKELAAQGVGNILCGIFGALPMTGVIVRSSANIQAGAKTRVSAILHGFWLLILVVAASFLLRLIPVSSLAAILVFTGYKLVNQGVLKSLRKYGRAEVFIYLATITAIVVTDLLQGVIFGLVLALAKLLYKFSRLQIQVQHEEKSKKTTLTLRGSATFLRLPDLTTALANIPSDRDLHIDFTHLEYIDHACLEALSSFEKQHQARGGRASIDWKSLEYLSRAPAPVTRGALEQMS